MNYFKCSVGGSGKGNTVIVTCAEEFAGQTIVLAKIGKRYTKTCPSTSPYEVRFYGVESGTYTVSATVQGQTYSETVVVQDVSCVLNYGFNWKTWVDTASQLDSTDYASLSEVLADEEAVRELFLEHACVDYMADSTSSNADLETIIENDLCAKWINNSDYALDYLGANVVIKALMDTADKYGYGEWVVVDDTTTPPTYGPKGNVPVMTANNAPYGTASSISEYASGSEAFRAFDGNPDTYWESAGESSMMASYVQYNFVNPICVKKAHYMAYKDSNTGNTLHVKYTASKDGGNSWFDLTDEITLSVSSDKQEYDIPFNNEEYVTSIRMYQYSAIYSGKYYALVREVQYYGRELWKQENSQYVPDYSEKEFEVGTTKKWLYDHGLELDTMITRTGEYGGNVITKNPDSIYLKNADTTGLKVYTAYMHQDDLSRYSLARAVIGEKCATVGQGTFALQVFSSDAARPANGSYDSQYDVAQVSLTYPVDSPYNLVLDLSNITQNYWVSFGGGWSGSYATLKELWLE